MATYITTICCILLLNVPHGVIPQLLLAIAMVTGQRRRNDDNSQPSAVREGRFKKNAGCNPKAHFKRGRRHHFILVIVYHTNACILCENAARAEEDDAFPYILN